MEMPGVPGLVFAALVVVAAYAVRSTAGFGAQAVAVPLLALVLPLHVVVPAITVVTALASVVAWRRDWRKIFWREILRLLPFTLMGVLIGLYLFKALDPQTLTRAFGIFIIVYGCVAFATASRSLPVPARFARLLGAVLGTASGLIATVFGAAAGPLYVIYLNTLRLEKDSFRVTITTILAFQSAFRVAGYAQLGFYNGTVALLIVAFLPLMLLGSRMGNAIAGRIDQHRFNLGVGVLLLASGVVLLLK
ncbi:MAG: hypothetical protein A3I02_01115 [Betaproteobacteria bacterium RIFCSPLOWO2_02_FULL_67_26]|nr:MAG: hypothetical protein A3I02_01115 [Betaproteobacteria bacterium RIFCSPLOWO2_02_FULL_67_26]